MIFLDTSVIVSILRKKQEGEKIKENLVNDSLAITSISTFELYYGARLSTRSRANLSIVKAFLEAFPIFDFSCGSAFIASAIQLDLKNDGVPIELNDVYIAAIVLENNGSLVTLNQDHFARIKGLKLHPA